MIAVAAFVAGVGHVQKLSSSQAVLFSQPVHPHSCHSCACPPLGLQGSILWHMVKPDTNISDFRIEHKEPTITNGSAQVQCSEKILDHAHIVYIYPYNSIFHCSKHLRIPMHMINLLLYQNGLIPGRPPFTQWVGACLMLLHSAPTIWAVDERSSANHLCLGRTNVRFAKKRHGESGYGAMAIVNMHLP